MITGLDHVIVAVSDLGAAAADASGLLGRDPSWRGSHPGAGTANALFQLDNTSLELLAPDGAGPVGDLLRARLAESGEGVAGLAFATGDADACAAALREEGWTPSDPQAGDGRDDAGERVRRWRNVYLPGRETRGLPIFCIERASGEPPLPAAPARGPEGACVAGLDHVVVMSPDLEASRHVYAAMLGLRLALDRSFEARGLRMLFFRTGGVTIEVVGRLGAAAAAAAGDEPPDRSGGLAWRVPDVDAAHARLAAGGFDPTDVRAGHKPGTRVCTARARTCGVPTLLIGPG